MRNPLTALNLEPISFVDCELLAPLMQEEEQAWLEELDWDYSPISKILLSFMKQRLLPGFALINGRRAVAYTYFLVYRHKGVIGTLYASRPDCQEAAERILPAAIESLKEQQNIRRIEAQIIPLHDLDPTSIFRRNGFEHYAREYLELDLASARPPQHGCPERIARWNRSYLTQAADVAFRSYHKSIDAEICADYGSKASCENYLRSLVDNPGCGIFMPEASFVGLDRRRQPCGFILTSRISPKAAMIPQISIHPAHQGRGLGSALIQSTVEHLRATGFETVRLTVTRRNRRAYEWYRRLGFERRRDFGAYLWKRD